MDKGKKEFMSSGHCTFTILRLKDFKSLLLSSQFKYIVLKLLNSGASMAISICKPSKTYLLPMV